MGRASRNETDVLVVGAGPVGLTIACELLRSGIRCRVVDKAEAPSETSKALAIQSRTLEVFEGMSVIEEFLARGLRVTGANVYEGEDPLFHPDTRHLRAPYPYILSLPQSGTERVLLGLLRELEWSKELVGFGQDRDRAVAFVGEDLEEIQAGWLVGGDGAHSRVRHTLVVPFEGSAYEEEFLLADVELDWEKNRDRAHAWLHEDGIFLSIPLPGDNQWRLIADLDTREGEEAPRASVKLFQELMEEHARDTHTTISNPAWMSNFRISRRMISEYRRGRVFLMGDAAHIHSPVGGQGMNTGIQDAYNLGWKLALVVRSKAPDKLLDTYEEERLPVAKGVLRATNLSTNLVVSRNPALRFVRDRALTHLMGSGFVQETLLGKVSQLDVNYRKSSISKSYESPWTLLPDGGQEQPGLKDWLNFRAALKAGDRASQGRCKLYLSRKETSLFEEMRGTGFTLLLFDGPACNGYKRLAGLSRRVEMLLGEAIKTYIVAGHEPDGLDRNERVLLDVERKLHESYGARAECLYLIRPDGYIGFRSQPAREDRLLDYLGELFLIGDAPHNHTPERPTVLDNS